MDQHEGSGLSLADQLRLVAFEAGMARFPKWMVAVVYEAAARLEGAKPRSAPGTIPQS